MEKKGKSLKTDVNGETVLPEALIQHIQSFLTGKEAAQTTILSKSWYSAWLTSTLNIDQSHFQNLDDQIEFGEFARKRMQRYVDLNMKIDRFRLRTIDNSESVELLANELIVKALQLGATDLNLDLMRSDTLFLPREVLESETLLRLSVHGRRIDGDVRCSMLKSLSLHKVNLNGDMFRDIVLCCALLEELELSPSYSIYMHEFELRKLRCLSLEKIHYAALFFSDFASKFPCLKDLSLVGLYDWNNPSLVFDSTSLEKVSFWRVSGPLTAELEVPNLVEFSYSGSEVPSISIKSSREWESNLFFKTLPRVTQSSFIKLHKLFKQLSPSKIYLSITN